MNSGKTLRLKIQCKLECNYFSRYNSSSNRFYFYLKSVIMIFCCVTTRLTKERFCIHFSFCLANRSFAYGKDHSHHFPYFRIHQLSSLSNFTKEQTIINLVNLKFYSIKSLFLHDPFSFFLILLILLLTSVWHHHLTRGGRVIKAKMLHKCY